MWLQAILQSLIGLSLTLLTTAAGFLTRLRRSQRPLAAPATGGSSPAAAPSSGLIVPEGARRAAVETARDAAKPNFGSSARRTLLMWLAGESFGVALMAIFARLEHAALLGTAGLLLCVWFIGREKE